MAYFRSFNWQPNYHRYYQNKPLTKFIGWRMWGVISLGLRKNNEYQVDINLETQNDKDSLAFLLSGAHACSVVALIGCWVVWSVWLDQESGGEVEEYIGKLTSFVFHRDSRLVGPLSTKDSKLQWIYSTLEKSHRFLSKSSTRQTSVKSDAEKSTRMKFCACATAQINTSATLMQKICTHRIWSLCLEREIPPKTSSWARRVCGPCAGLKRASSDDPWSTSSTTVTGHRTLRTTRWVAVDWAAARVGRWVIT